MRPRANTLFRKVSKKIIKRSKLERDIKKQLAHMRQKRKPEFHTGDRYATRVYECVMLSEAETVQKLMSKLEKCTKSHSICASYRLELAEILSGLLTNELKRM